MAKPKLKDLMKQAQEHIKAGRYDKARAILERIDAKVDNSTVKKWLARLDEIAPKDDPISDLEFPEKTKKKRGKLWWAGVGLGACMLLTVCSIFGQTVGIIPDATERVMTSVAESAGTDAVLSLTPPTATDTLIPTETPIPTETDIPTNTPTLSPVPSDTLAPSETPLPNATPTIIQTSPPTNTAIPSVPTTTATLEFASQEEIQIFTWLSQQANVEAVTRVIGDGGQLDSFWCKSVLCGKDKSC